MLIGKVFWQAKLFNIKERFYSVTKYYKYQKFALADFSLMLVSFFINPYKISKKFLKKNKEQNIHAYGETPLRSLEKIISECGIGPRHKVVELGFGRGLCSFWLSQAVGCDVTAVERIPFFYTVAKFISKIFGMKNLNFICGDMSELNFGEFDFAYIYGTSWDDEIVLRLAEKIKATGDKIKVITVSYPLADYEDGFECLKEIEVSFPWGKTSCFLNRPF